VTFGIWFLVIFFSVFLHEMGHALTALIFGKKPVIELNMMGGITYFYAQDLKKWQQFLIVLNGPLVGFLLYFGASKLLVSQTPGSIAAYVFAAIAGINLFWTVLNLLPILPLDGGQLIRIACEGIFKNKGLYAASIFSLVISCALALIGFLLGQYLFGAILFIFCFQNFELARQSRFLTSVDQQEEIRNKLSEAVYFYETGQIEKAQNMSKELMELTKQGFIFNQSLSLFALTCIQNKDYNTAYNLLKTAPKAVQEELAYVFHEAAFFENDLELVEKLSADAFLKNPNKYVAFHAAIASDFCKKTEAAIGWLKTAYELGLTEEEIKAHPSTSIYASKIGIT
jgi:Zn-dependent protease